MTDLEPGRVNGVCRKCEEEILNVTPDEGKRWEDDHRGSCPRKDDLPLW